MFYLLEFFIKWDVKKNDTLTNFDKTPFW